MDRSDVRIESVCSTVDQSVHRSADKSVGETRRPPPFHRLRVDLESVTAFRWCLDLPLCLYRLSVRAISTERFPSPCVFSLRFQHEFWPLVHRTRNPRHRVCLFECLRSRNVGRSVSGGRGERKSDGHSVGWTSIGRLE